MTLRTDLDVGFPFELDGRGRVTDPDYATHVRQLIELVLFTSPGERVNRPDFGCGLLEVIFAGVTDLQASTVHVMIQVALQKWLGTVIAVDAVEARSHGDSGAGASMSVTVAYRLLRSGEPQKATFVAPDLP